MKWWKTTLVIFGAVIITALGIDAADTFTGSEGTLLSQVIGSKPESRCPSGMSVVENTESIRCVDTYEASPSSACLFSEPQSQIQTLENIQLKECNPVSVSERAPWTYVTLSQAQELCSKVGKRLPTGAEWYVLALGTHSENCVTDVDAPLHSGSRKECKSHVGVYDMVGNVWEWVNETVVDQTYHGRVLPSDGYVADVDSEGVAITTSLTDKLSLFSEDYFWSEPNGSYGMIRGGFYGGGTDAGIFSANAGVLGITATQGIGFRCVK